MNKYLSISELRRKGEYYCSYQERCHTEVYKKLKTFTSSNTDINEVITKLIADDFLNETRFSESFVRGKFKNKNWGKIRLALELKKRSISKKNIEIAMKQISQSIYEAKFKQRFNFLTTNCSFNCIYYSYNYFILFDNHYFNKTKKYFGDEIGLY